MGPTIRIGQESWCLLYAGVLVIYVGILTEIYLESLTSIKSGRRVLPCVYSIIVGYLCIQIKP